MPYLMLFNDLKFGKSSLFAVMVKAVRFWHFLKKILSIISKKSPYNNKGANDFEIAVLLHFHDLNYFN